MLVFRWNDSPLARGRLQNAKFKRKRTRSEPLTTSELPTLSQKPGRLARIFILVVKSDLRADFNPPSGIPKAHERRTAADSRTAHDVSVSYMLAKAMFSTVWKTFRGIFHTMEKLWPIFPHNGKSFGDFSTQWKNFFHGVQNSDFGLFSRVLGCSLGAVERSTRRPM